MWGKGNSSRGYANGLSKKLEAFAGVLLPSVFRRVLGPPSVLSLDFGCTISNFNEVGPKRKEAMDLAHAKSDKGGADSPSLGCQETLLRAERVWCLAPRFPKEVDRCRAKATSKKHLKGVKAPCPSSNLPFPKLFNEPALEFRISHSGQSFQNI